MQAVTASAKKEQDAELVTQVGLPSSSSSFQNAGWQSGGPGRKKLPCVLVAAPRLTAKMESLGYSVLFCCNFPPVAVSLKTV